MTNEKPKTDDWSDFAGKYIKADAITTWPALFIPMSLETSYDADENSTLVYTGEFYGKKKLWQPNKTNIASIKALGIKSPTALIGKKVFFQKCMNFNPVTKTKVPGLEIDTIE